MQLLTVMFAGLAMVAAAVLVLKYLFGISVRLETREAARSRRQLRQHHQRLIRRREQEALEEIIEQNIEKIRKDFQKTTKKMNQYVSDSVNKALADELATYKKSADKVKTVAVDSIERAVEAFEQQQKEIDKSVAKQTLAIKEQLVAKVEDELSEVLRFYVEQILRDNIGIEDQIDGIINELENDKAKILKDMQGGS